MPTARSAARPALRVQLASGTRAAAAADRSSRRLAWIALAALLAGALALRLWGVKQGLPYAYNADEADHFVPRAVSMFAAPIARASSLASPARASAASLCGTVTFAPRKPEAGSAGATAANSRGGTGRSW